MNPMRRSFPRKWPRKTRSDGKGLWLVIGACLDDTAEKVRSSMTSAFHEEKVAVEGVADKNQGAFWFHSCREMRCLTRVSA